MKRLTVAIVFCFLFAVSNAHVLYAIDTDPLGISNAVHGVFGAFGSNNDNANQKVKHNTHKIKHNTHLVYEGYSKSFMPIRRLFMRGRLTQVCRLYEKKDKKIMASCNKNRACFIDKIGFLGSVERGSIFLDVGKPDKSVFFFTGAESVLKKHENWSEAHTVLSNVSSFIAQTVTGNDEIKPYYGTGYERVLMLNYKTIAFMLEGEKGKAYNVTRRAIEWQEMERRRFEKKHKEVAKKLREESKKLNKKSVKGNIRKQIADIYKHADIKASEIASAYVNPFGYYMAGVIQEIKSLNDPSLIYNARISYKKALQLNPKSKVIKSAVEDLSRRKSLPKDRKLIHIIINEGFAPAKKVATYYFVFGDAYIPIKLAVCNPVKEKPSYIVVKTLSGKKVTSLSPVADIEAIVLRHQKDMEPFVALRITTTLLRYYLKRKLLNGALSTLTEAFAEPDTRSWMMLPRTILGARFYLPKDAKKIMVVVYNRGHVVAKRVVNVHGDSPTFIYGIHVGKLLKLYNAAM